MPGNGTAGHWSMEDALAAGKVSGTNCDVEAVVTASFAASSFSM